MLESMRKHAQGWLAKFILGAIILSFALWGIGDYFTGNQIETVAEIDGETINNVDFGATYQRQLNRYKNMLGDQFTKALADQIGVKNETIQTMINRRLMLVEANTMGLVAPDQVVLGTVQSNPAFSVDKTFSASLYQGLVRRMGFASARDYENYLRQSIRIDTLQKGIMGAATVSDEEVLARFKTKFEKRVLTAIVVNPESLKSGIKVNDEQARDWYDAHASSYQSPLKVELELVDINAKNLMKDMDVSEADIEQAYTSRETEFSTPEKRKASHILVRVARDASDDVLAVAEAKIDAAKKRIDAGEKFADVAKDVSDDVTASEGGNLGFFAKGSMVPEFEDAAFSQLKVGEVSDVIRTQFGLHLVQLNAIEGGETKPLSEVHDMLAAQLREEAAANEAYRLSQDLDNALGMEDSLQAAAASVNLSVRKLGKLSTENVLADPLLGASDELKGKAFSMMPGDAVDIVEVNNGEFVALEVLNRINPETMAYDEVVKRVYADVKADLAAKQAQTIADEILTAAKSGEKMKALAQKFSQPEYTSKAVLSSGEGDTAAWIQGVLDASFRTPAESWVNVTLPTAQGIAVVYVQAVQEADDTTFATESDAVREEALKSKAAVRFARWMASVRNRHEITINNKVLDRF